MHLNQSPWAARQLPCLGWRGVWYECRRTDWIWNERPDRFQWRLRHRTSCCTKFSEKGSSYVLSVWLFTAVQGVCFLNWHIVPFALCGSSKRVLSIPECSEANQNRARLFSREYFSKHIMQAPGGLQSSMPITSCQICACFAFLRVFLTIIKCSSLLVLFGLHSAGKKVSPCSWNLVLFSLTVSCHFQRIPEACSCLSTSCERSCGESYKNN